MESLPAGVLREIVRQPCLRVDRASSLRMTSRRIAEAAVDVVKYEVQKTRIDKPTAMRGILAAVAKALAPSNITVVQLNILNHERFTYRRLLFPEQAAVTRRAESLFATPRSYTLYLSEPEDMRHMSQRLVDDPVLGRIEVLVTNPTYFSREKALEMGGNGGLGKLAEQYWEIMDATHDTLWKEVQSSLGATAVRTKVIRKTRGYDDERARKIIGVYTGEEDLQFTLTTCRVVPMLRPVSGGDYYVEGRLLIMHTHLRLCGMVGV